MGFKKYAYNVIKIIRGNLPTIVFIWYIIWVFVALMTVSLICYWYFVLYSVAYGQEGMVLEREYKHIIDEKVLKNVLEKYNKL